MALNDRFQLLDCTLRDGGFSIDFDFGYENIRAIAQKLSDAKIDIIELGFLKQIDNYDPNLSLYKTCEDLAWIIPKRMTETQIFTGMITYPEFPLEYLPQRKEFYCDAIRVIIRYSELKASCDFCREVAKRGYIVFIQAAITMRYSREELQTLFDTANEIGAYALYIVDSYGYMNKQDIIDHFNLFDDHLNSSIRIGFHAHNNMDLAFSNAITFIEQKTDRNIIVDSTLFGIGQGSGNLQTEIIVNYLNKMLNTKYDFNKILEGDEIIEKFKGKTAWGYSVVDLIAAINKTSYRYSQEMYYRYNIPLVKINSILKNITGTQKHQYTTNNLIKILEDNGININHL